jgi:riboflavin synthase
MFTGIIEEVGTVGGWLRNNLLRINCRKINNDFHLGDSISVNGICLTINNFDDSGFSADVSLETQKRWCAKNYQTGCRVNLERALSASGRLGGHFVQGHVDGIGLLQSIRRGGDFIELSIALSQQLEKFVAEKGSIAIDGISLTVNKVENNIIFLMIIPHTYQNTALAFRNEGSGCNVEVDILAKYVARLINDKNRIETTATATDREFFLRSGFAG